MKHTTIFALLIAVSILLVGCIQIAQFVPTEGIWCCKELGIIVDFDSGTCVTRANGIDIKCNFNNDRGSRFISISNQDDSVKDYYLGETLFSGECIRCDESEMIISEHLTGTIYIFTKTGNGSA